MLERSWSQPWAYTHYNYSIFTVRNAEHLKYAQHSSDGPNIELCGQIGEHATHKILTVCCSLQPPYSIFITECEIVFPNLLVKYCLTTFLTLFCGVSCFASGINRRWRGAREWIELLNGIRYVTQHYTYTYICNVNRSLAPSMHYAYINPRMSSREFEIKNGTLHSSGFS